MFGRHYFPRARATHARQSETENPNASNRDHLPVRIPFTRCLATRCTAAGKRCVIVKVKDMKAAPVRRKLPRSYVTGETTESMIARMRQDWREVCATLRARLGDIEYLIDAADWTKNDDGKTNVVAWNAAYCAVELALLDWSLRADACALSDLLLPARFEVVYSGVISADAPADAAALAKRMARLGMQQIKVKVGTHDDFARLEAVRKAVGDGVELRADANGAWSADEAVAQLQGLAKFKLAAIEQPVRGDDYTDATVRDEGGVPVMADESLVTLEQARRLIELGACDYFNIRLSKNGGIAGSSAIAKLAQEAGIKIQVGAQVGETGILSSAGRTFAAHLPALEAPKAPRYLALTEDTPSKTRLRFRRRAPLLKPAAERHGKEEP